MVEVFKTNVSEEKDAAQLLKQLQNASAQYKVNFDLDDCDRILRIESTENIEFQNVIFIIKAIWLSGGSFTRLIN